MHLALSFALLCGSASHGEAQDPPASDAALTAVLEPVRARHGVPALGAVSIELGQPHRFAAVGVKRAGAPERIELGDRWHLGSCGKAMTATLAGVLVDAGELRWNATLGELFPERAEAMHPELRGVSLRQLLDHRAGLPRDETLGLTLLRRSERAQSAAEQRSLLVARVLSAPPAAPPGSQHAYSNAGYWIAGAAIERAAGVSWEQAMQARLFAPLGMSSSGFGPPRGDDESAANCGHELVLGRVVPCDPGAPRASYPHLYGPAGDVHASLEDTARFLAFHLVAPAEGALLSQTRWEEMHAPIAGASYACGFAIATATWSKGPVLAHHGSSARWHAFLQAAPAERRGLIVVCNQGGAAGESACVEAALELELATRRAR